MAERNPQILADEATCAFAGMGHRRNCNWGSWGMRLFQLVALVVPVG